MDASEKYTAETIQWVRRWTPKLLSFSLTRPKDFRFTPGQFARLGVQKSSGDAAQPGTIAWRAYSVVSGADDNCLEFFSVIVPDGEFTTELAAMSAGAVVFVEKTAYGFLTCDRFEKGPDLWLLATGTGLGPYISILKDPHTWQEFANIVVVHSVRETDELAYRDTLEAYALSQPGRDAGARLHYVPIVTRAQVDGWLHQRIPAALASGALEARVGLPLNRERARVMICGNPQMVADTRKCLSARGLAPARRGAPGQLAVENYW